MLMTTDLPFDLERKILARVPKKSPLRWQSACKRWYTLRQDLLAEKHLAQAGREFILLLNTSVFSTIINLQEIHNNFDDPSMELGGKLGSLQDSDDLKIHDIFYCKGLILCTMVGNQKLVVCNPCNGETRYVEPKTSYHNNDLYALGYKGSKSSYINSYKILRYCRYDNMQLGRTVSEFELYDFVSDSWRVLDVDKHDWDISARGVSVKGNTYWVAKQNDDQFILSFDFTREKFGSLPLPYESAGPDVDYKHEDTAVLSVVRDEQLSMLHQYLHLYSSEMRIWVSSMVDTKKVSWDEFLVVDVVLLNVVSFILDEEHKVAVCCTADKDDSDEEEREEDFEEEEEESTSIAIIGENIQSHVYDERIIDGSWPHIMNYVPSPIRIVKKSTRKSKRKQITRHEAEEGISARSVEETKVTPKRKPKAYRSF